MIAHLAASLLPLLAPSVPELPQAPDGRPGLGAESSLSEILGVFRSPDDEQEQLLVHLVELESRLAVLEATTRAAYLERGYFAVLDRRDEASLERLHEVARAFLDDPERVLAERMDAETRRTWARLFLDPRFRVRMDVLAGWRADAASVTKGLGLLRATTDGWARVREDEAQNVAARVDLAAALLRARLKDLEALREDGGPEEVSEEALASFLALLELPPGPERQAGLDREGDAMRATVERMGAVLFTTRLAEEALAWLQWRELRDGHAATKRAEVRVWQPQTDEGKEAPHEIGKVKKTTRRREAFRRALEGLSYDPLDEEMTYAAALMAQYVSGQLDTLSLYDRYLALRGIRLHEFRTWGRDRDLTDEEEDAISYLQQYESESPPGPPPGG